MRRRLPLLALGVLLLAGCSSDLHRLARQNAGRPLPLLWLAGDYGHALFCAEVEANGWFEHPVPQGIDPAQAARYAELTAGADPYRIAVAAMFSPSPAGNVEDGHGNPTYRPAAPGTVNCYCWSRARREVLAVCPKDPDRWPPGPPATR